VCFCEHGSIPSGSVLVCFQPADCFVHLSLRDKLLSLCISLITLYQHSSD